ncbi:MAG: hypothetical protein PUD14_07050 [Prevotellaceae bacterium]|nr:hypothetical protein [Prevotellaceae bacterium]
MFRCRGRPVCLPNVGTTYFRRFSLWWYAVPALGGHMGRAPTSDGLFPSNLQTLQRNLMSCRAFSPFRYEQVTDTVHA